MRKEGDVGADARMRNATKTKNIKTSRSIEMPRTQKERHREVSASVGSLRHGFIGWYMVSFQIISLTDTPKERVWCSEANTLSGMNE